jgi:hypothetical protein
MQLLKDLRFFFRCYRIAKQQVVLLHAATEYPGVVRTNMAVNYTRTALQKAGVPQDSINPAVIFVAVGFAFILNPKKELLTPTNEIITP